MKRCLTCGNLTKGSRCEPCRLGLKRVRSVHARVLGPCPQTGRCHLCGGEATVEDPFTWDHLKPLVAGGGPDARPAHRSCNSRRGRRPL